MLARFAQLSAFVIVLTVATPWALYAAGLVLVAAWPEPAKLEASAPEKLALWKQVKGTGAPNIEPLTPISYFGGISEVGREHGSMRLAWLVARAHNAKHLRVQGNLWWHYSGAAMTIWLTRNWSIDQLLSKAAELQAKSAA
jgi:hypothetical protein